MASNRVKVTNIARHPIASARNILQMSTVTCLTTLVLALRVKLRVIN